MRMLCSDCTLEISEPTVVIASVSSQVLQFDQAIKSSICNLGDKNVKEITSCKGKSYLVS